MIPRLSHHVCTALPRLVIYIVLNEVEEAVNLLGPECGSWGLPARGTSLRTYVNIFGAMAVPFVAEANECIGKTLAK